MAGMLAVIFRTMLSQPSIARKKERLCGYLANFRVPSVGPVRGRPEFKIILKAISFALVGVVNTAVDATVFFLLLAYATSSLIVANVIAWLVAVTGSYVMNSFTTFAAETGRELQLKRYFGFVASGIAAVTATTVTVVIAAKFMPIWVAKAIAVLVSFAINFSITLFVVFRQPKR